jgi:hypothetical protein
MERNTVTTFSELKTGDRFYRSNDKTKTVWEKDSVGNAKQYNQQYAMRMRSNEQVIYLRSNIN